MSPRLGPAAQSELLISASEAMTAMSELVFVEIAPWRAMTMSPDPIEGSIPGARLASVATDFAGTPTPTSGHLPLPDAESVTELVASWGDTTPEQPMPFDVSHAPIVVYTRRCEEFSSSTRAWFTLLQSGIGHVRVLDGGLPAWAEAGGPLGDSIHSASGSASDRPSVPRRDGAHDSVATKPPFDVLDVEKVQWVAATGTLLDARPEAAYNGTADVERSGHIPGARNAPMTELLDPRGRLRDATWLRRWFLARNAVGRHQVAAYCGGGVASSALVFAGATIGKRVDLYIDSWSAWERDLTLPVEKTSGPATAARGFTDC